MDDSKSASVGEEAPADGALSRIGKLIVSIGSPLALITALMFYFGWVRTQVQARELGYDVAVLQLSTPEYLLKSVNVLFPVAAATLLLMIAAYAAYLAAVGRIQDAKHKRLTATRAYRAAAAGAIVAVCAGVICYIIPATRPAAIPFALTVATLCVLAQGKLRPHIGKQPWSKTSQILALTLLAMLLFWDTERIAGTLGREFAHDIAHRPHQFAEIIAYSQNELNIDAEGVRQQVLGTAEDEYRYRYTGLRLMEQTGEKYVLINELWGDGRGRVIVLENSDALRFEFVQPPPEQP